MSAITLFDLNGEQRFTGTSVGGGSVTPSSATATVTTSASTFWVVQQFDLGHATLAYVKATVLALTPDGETFGAGAGDVYFDTAFDPNVPAGGNAGVSRDAVAFFTAGNTWIHQTPVVAVNGVLDSTIEVPRYLRVAAFIGSVDTGDIYAGANHPGGQVRWDLEYL